MSTTSWIAPEKPDLVWFSGPDAERFLNDLISQEISDMEPGTARRSLLLGPQGKLDHILWVIREDDRFGLVTESGRGAELAGTLGRYLIRVDVTIEIESGQVWLVMGASDGYDVSWSGAERHLIVGDRPDLPDGSDSEYESLRIEAGEPRWGIDVDERTIPEESGLVQSSVDFSKGCYLGQELVARINSRGRNVPRRLRVLELDQPAETGSPIEADGKEVGILTSTAGVLGLALVGRGVEPGDTLQVGDTSATLRGVPPKPQT